MNTQTGEIRMLPKVEAVIKNEVEISPWEAKFLEDVPKDARSMTLCWIRFYYGFIKKKYPKISPIEKEKLQEAFKQGWHSNMFMGTKEV